MKSIVILIDDRPFDVISYNATKYDDDKEKHLVIKFMNKQVCDIKEIYVVNPYKLIITSKKGTVFNLSWKRIIVWNESQLED